MKKVVTLKKLTLTKSAKYLGIYMDNLGKCNNHREAQSKEHFLQLKIFVHKPESEINWLFVLNWINA